MNEELNPTRMTYETRLKIRKARLNTGKGKSYPKLFGKHLHRVVAEVRLKRKLRPGEIVHHEDENKRNASPENLRVFTSQSEHAASHMQKRGDAE
ncbi:MAG: HNH endonuclease [Syntrophothermus sp.]|nr:HNH endonuclease [Syntrophothermus sp.]